MDMSNLFIYLFSLYIAILILLFYYNDLAVRIGLLYVLAGFGGSLMSCINLDIAGKPTLSVGASGALFGLLGAMLSELFTNWTIYANKVTSSFLPI